MVNRQVRRRRRTVYAYANETSCVGGERIRRLIAFVIIITSHFHKFRVRNIPRLSLPSLIIDL